MRRRAFVALCALSALPLQVAHAAPVTVDELQGTVTAANFGRLERFVGDHLDRIVGLKIAVDASQPAGLNASADAGHFVVYLARNTRSEIVARSGFRLEHGAYVFDGFFLVKSGGMHQGIISYGLEQVSEATVRLNRDVRIRRQALRR